MTLAFILNALWQDAIVVALTAATLHFVSPRNATTRYAVWFAALLALVAVPMLTTFSQLGTHLITMMEPQGYGRALFTFVPVGAVVDRATQWFGWPAFAMHSIDLAAGVLWFAGSALALGRLALSFARVGRIRRSASTHSLVDGIAVLASEDLTIPIATGLASPAIVLPSGLIANLSEDDLRCAVEHELAHLRRGDVAGNAVQRILEAVFFWNPCLRLVGRHLVYEREAACDDWAVRRIGQSIEYASCLATLGRSLTRSSAPLLTPSIVGSRNALVARIERLLTGDRRPSDAKINYLPIGAVTMLFVLTTLIFQAVSPAQVHAAPSLSALGATTVASSACKDPNADVKAIAPVAPDLPKPEWPRKKVFALVEVTVAPSGKATAARVYKSSGDANVDRAVVTAAVKSTYSPKLANCVAIESTYMFRADFAP
ncbi:MAG TPA: TonB family protein [Candidatus Cybelea sp.]|jgi:TonB family protein|nr:TonB family protein [Candidatus Cybelea sp.]